MENENYTRPRYNSAGRNVLDGFIPKSSRSLQRLFTCVMLATLTLDPSANFVKQDAKA
jgi:hypothetical protein